MATHSSTLALKIPWAEELGAGYYPWGCKELGTTERLHFHFQDIRTTRIRNKEKICKGGNNILTMYAKFHHDYLTCSYSVACFIILSNVV